MIGMDCDSQRTEGEILIIPIWRVYLNDFWGQEPGKMRVKLAMLRQLGVTSCEYLGLEYCFSLMGT